MNLEENGFWSSVLYSNKYGVHAMFPPDILHTIPKGIVDILRRILLSYTNDIVVDERLAKIPMVRDVLTRNLHYRAFSTGISSMSVFTADDMVALVQQLPYVVGTGTGIPLLFIVIITNNPDGFVGWLAAWLTLLAGCWQR